jgi:hypothetical protein
MVISAIMGGRRTTCVLAGFAVAVLGPAAGCTGSPSSSPAPGSSAANAPVAYRNIETLADHVDAAEARAKTAHFGFSTSGASPATRGTGQLDASNPQHVTLSMKASAGNKRLRIVHRNDAFYVENPHAATGVKPWIKIDQNADDPASKAFGALLSQLARAADPSQTMHTLAKTGTITGSQVRGYRGQHVRRYTVTIESKKLAAEELNRLGDELATAKRAQLRDKLHQLPGTLTAHVLVNRQDLPVKVAASFPGPGEPQAQTRFTTTLSRWGEPVHITAPRKSEVRTPLTAGH